MDKDKVPTLLPPPRPRLQRRTPPAPALGPFLVGLPLATVALNRSNHSSSRPPPVVNNAASIWDSPSQTLLPPTQTPDGALTATATKSGLTWSPSTKDRCGNFDIVSDHFSLSSTPPRTRRDVPNALLSGHAYRMLIGVHSI